MDVIRELFDKFKEFFIWWTVVMPWEEALIIRWGSKVRHKKKGVHFKIPYADRVVNKCTRTQVVQSAPQTVTDERGDNIVICVAIDYHIEDLEELYNEALEPEQMLVSRANGYIVDAIKGGVDPCSLLLKCINENMFGLRVTDVNIITHAKCRTFRLIQDSHFVQDGEKLDTFE